MVDQENSQIEWSLREYLLLLFQQWYYPLAAFLGGSVIGWFVMFVAPSEFQANRIVSVTVFGVKNVRNLDDYKNAQIRHLETLIFSDSTMIEVLNDLKIVSHNWETMDIDQLRNNYLSTWQDVGFWRLSATYADPIMAREALESWESNSINEVSIAKEKGGQSLLLISDMEYLSQEINALKNSKNRYGRLKKILFQKRETSEELLPEDNVKNRTLSKILDIEKLLKKDSLLALQIPDLGKSDLLVSEYQEWLDLVIGEVQNRIDDIAEEILGLDLQRDTLKQENQSLIDQTFGIDQGLNMERIESKETSVSQIRENGLFLLFGGLLGIVIWLIIIWIKVTHVNFQ
ncbi:MAG: hypothetical protein N2D54_06000 [Chloroflexota bacterium]